MGQNPGGRAATIKQKKLQSELARTMPTNLQTNVISDRDSKIHVISFKQRKFTMS